MQINNLGVDPSSGVVQLPVDLADPSQQVVTGCNAQGSRFVATGRGGLPLNPNEQVGSDRPWSDIRDVSQLQQQGQPITHIAPRNPLIIEATELKRNPNGTLELIATPDANLSNFSAQATCTTAIAR